MSSPHEGRDEFLSFAPPSLGQDEIREVAEALRSGWITTGPRAARLEEEFAAYLGAPAALALNSGTAALHLGLLVSGVGPGDSVVSSVMTFPGAISVIEQAGAEPVLVDVSEDTLNIDPEQVGRSLQQVEQPPKAILPVHLYGHPCNLQDLRSLATEHGMAIVEDAAHALPARHDGELIGSTATTAFSFYATKNMTTGEGGMLTASKELVEEARVLSLHGMARDAHKRSSSSRPWYYEVVAPGFKYNMSDIQAALGIHQLRKLPMFHARRREIVDLYDRAFAGRDELQLPTERSGMDSACHLYVIRLHLERLRIDRDRFIEEMGKRNIGTGVHFIPVHLHPYFAKRYGFKPGDFPVAWREFHRIVSLPLYPSMSDGDVQDVIDAVIDVLDRSGK